MIVIYFLLAFTATTCGSLAGLGGGVIIKPVLDVLGQDSLRTISVLSSSTIFSMAVVSTVRQFLHGFRPNRIMIFLTAGAILGGLSGSRLFSMISENMNPENLKGMQALIIAGLLIIVLVNNRLPDFEIRNSFGSAAIGFLLGLISAFLGIGGGPINVVILCMFLAMKIKDAAVVSILIILFSQGAKLALIGLETGFAVYEGMNRLIYMIPGGVFGGLFGPILTRNQSNSLTNKFSWARTFP